MKLTPLKILILSVLLATTLLFGLSAKHTSSSFKFKEQSITTVPLPIISMQTISPTENKVLDKTTDIKVTRVIDGDTFVLETGQTVRLIGIDTPELHHPRKPVGCFAVEANNQLINLILNKSVRLEKDVSETDRYGRLLRFVYLSDNTFVNDVLVRQGYALAATFPPDVKFSPQFIEAEREARDSNRGLWSACNNNSYHPPAKVFPTTDQTPPNANCNIKGNISVSTGQKIYHQPGQKYYNKTVVDETKGEKWFCNETEAQAAGFRKSKQ